MNIRTDNVITTKEQWEQLIKMRFTTEASKFGITPEEYKQAVLSGSILTLPINL
jgi:hypothetical protein